MKFRSIGFVLWGLVLLYGCFFIYQRLSSRSADPGAETAAVLPPDYDGRVIVETPWKRLPQVKPFVLTERSGQEFDSRSLAGRPYVLSFFFTTCPTICRDLNRQIGVLANRFKESDVTFIGLSVDARTDTPEVLRAYASDFDADPERWLMMTTQQQFKITEIATQQLNTLVDEGHHTGDIFLIDRWGRFRDRFSWDNPEEMKRFGQVLQEVLAETEPPLDKVIATRNVHAGIPHQLLPVTWLRDFQLTDQQGELFFSRDLTGQAWVGSFFFTRCGTVCPQQNAWLAKLQPDIEGRGARLVSISTDPEFDRPDVLRPYARNLQASKDWKFLTGDEAYIQRIGSEFLGLPVHGEHHSSLLAIVDRWGNVRARINWQDPDADQLVLQWLDCLNQEGVPVVDFEVNQLPGEMP